MAISLFRLSPVSVWMVEIVLFVKMVNIVMIVEIVGIV